MIGFNIRASIATSLTAIAGVVVFWSRNNYSTSTVMVVINSIVEGRIGSLISLKAVFSCQ